MVKENLKKKLKHSQRNIKNEEIYSAFHILLLSVIDFYQLLKKTRRQFHSNELSDPKWNVITILEHIGHQTVPQIARSQRISRQGIQNTVNLLFQEGHVEFIENPAHKKSPLVRLTPKGKSLAYEMSLREKEIISKINFNIEPEDMRKAAKVMQLLKIFFESKQWKEVLEKSKSKPR